ncbi:MAG TPA: hypothetical protein VMB80_14850 [Candidatus Acidoferrum sp.]|nr:hypothetical protein [Candidatus Acidoferrum sp.]
MKNFRILLCVLTVLSTAYPALAQTWTQTSAPSNLWYAVASSAGGGKLVAVIGGQFWNGQIYTSTNAGATWTLTTAPSLHWNYVASSADGSRLAAVVYGGGIYTSTDAGATWYTNNLASQNWFAIASSADGLKLAAVYSNSRVYLSTNGGAAWTSNTAPAADLRCIASSADGTKLVAGNNVGRIVTSTNSGVTWMQPAALSGSVDALASSADGRNLFAILSGVGYSSTNSGNTWATNSFARYIGGGGGAAASADGAKLIAQAAKSPLCTSTNFGYSWNTNSALNLVWSAVASSADGNRLVATVWGGGIWTGQATPSSHLDLWPTNGSFVLSWTIPSTNFVLQQSPDLASWSNVTNLPVLNLTNLQNEVLLSPTGSNSFYRLKTP